MELRNKDYLTFLELVDRWSITISDLLHLIVTGKIAPTVFLNGEFEALFSDLEILSEADRAAIAGYGHTYSYSEKEDVICNGFFTLTHRHETGINQCKFARAMPVTSTFGRHRPSLAFVGINLKESIQSDTLVNSAVFTRAAIKQFEQDHLSEKTSRDEPVCWQGFDIEDPKYPQELDIALQAWTAACNMSGGGTAKEQVMVWLNQSGYKLSGAAIERIATICNWDKSGGRPRNN